MEKKFRPKTQEQLVRQLSRATLNAQQRGKLPLLEKLTATNADKIETLSEQKPIFWQNNENAQTTMWLDPSIQKILPSEFFQNPTQWIESQPNIKRYFEEEDLPKGKNIAELKELPYDISKVKEITLKKDNKIRQIISKRISSDELNEIARQKKAYAAGIPTPKVLGEILDHSNTYAFLENVKGINLRAAYSELNIYKYWDKYCGMDMEYCFTPRDIKDQMEHYLFRKLPKETKKQLVYLWQENVPNFKKFISLVDIRDMMATPYVSGTKAPRQYALDILQMHNWYKQTEQILQQELNISLSSFFGDFLPPVGFSFLDSSMQQDYEKKTEEMLKKISFIQKKTKQKILEFQKKWQKIIDEQIFGFSITNEGIRLQKLCHEKGVEHKDFAPRNLLIKWDFKKNQPIKPVGDEPKLYIIDWEEKKPNHAATPAPTTKYA